MKSLKDSKIIYDLYPSEEPHVFEKVFVSLRNI